MSMFKKLTMLLCASLFFLSQSVLASEQEATADRAAEAAEEMSQEAPAAGSPIDEEKMKMQEGSEQEEENKDETPANEAETR